MELNARDCEGDCVFGAPLPPPRSDGLFMATEFSPAARRRVLRLEPLLLLSTSLWQSWEEAPQQGLMRVLAHLRGDPGIFPKKICSGLGQYLTALLLACHDLRLSLQTACPGSPLGDSSWPIDHNTMFRFLLPLLGAP